MYDTILDANAERELWLAERRKGIGSSDAPGILGVSPWSSELDVYTDKLGLQEDVGQTQAAFWGQAIEPLLIEWFAKETGRCVLRDGRLLASKERPWQMCTLDARQLPVDAEDDDEQVLECKVTRLYWNWDDGLPIWVSVQIQHQLAVTGLSKASICVLFNGNEAKWADVERNDDAIRYITAAEENFLKKLEALEPPAPDEKVVTQKALALLYPKSHTGEIITLDDAKYVRLDEEYDFIISEAKKLEDDKRAIGNQFRAVMGDNEVAYLSNGTKWTWRSDKRGTRVLRRSPA